MPRAEIPDGVEVHKIRRCPKHGSPTSNFGRCFVKGRWILYSEGGLSTALAGGGPVLPEGESVEVMPVSEYNADLESLAQELEGRAQQSTGSEHAVGKSEAFHEAAQEVRANVVNSVLEDR